MRSRVALALVIALLLLAACSTTKGSGQLATAQRAVSGFTKVELAGQGDLSIEQTGTDSLEDAFLALTGSSIRDEKADSAAQMRQFANMWRKR